MQQDGRVRVSVLLALAMLAGLIGLGGLANGVVLSGTNGLIATETAANLTALDPATGTRSTLLGSNGGDDDPEVAPSGSKVAFENGNQIFVADFPSGNNRTMVTTAGANFTPAWNPGSSLLVFQCQTGLCTAPPANAAPVTQLTGSQVGDTDPDFNPAGNFIVFDRPGVGIVRLNADGSGARTTLAATTGADDHPRVTPDGSKVFFDVPGTGIVSLDFPNGGNRSVLTGTVNGDDDPTVSPDGTKVAFDTAAGIFTLNANGTNGRAQVSGTAAGDQQPGFQSATAPPTPTPTGGTPTPPPGQIALTFLANGCFDATTTSALQAAGYNVGCATARRFKGTNARDAVAIASGATSKVSLKKGNDCLAAANGATNKNDGGKDIDTLASSDGTDRNKKFETTSSNTCPV